MKKFLSIIMVLAMILAMGTTVFAADANITINGDADRVYNGYKLLDLTTSLKEVENHPDDCDGTNHTDACYNYAYTVNEKYRAILQDEVYSNGSINPQPTDKAAITDVQILEYLENQKSDTNGEYKSMREVADRIYRAIKEENIPADAQNIDGKNNSIAQGYWMFADVTDLTGNEANSLVMVDTAGQDAITITPKTALPTVEKKVKDIDDSTDAIIADNDWQDSADHDIEDTVPFKLTATLPSNVANYESYKIIFHDLMSAGLTFNPASVKVYMYNSKADADADTELGNYFKDVTALFAVSTTNMAANESFTVSCDNVLGIEGITKDTAFVVYYEATLNEGAVIGSQGNPNEVYLEFSNNPYGEGTGKTENDKVIVFTYQININKVDSDNKPLKGAGFTLYKKDTNGEYIAIGNEIKGTDITTFTWKGLDDGAYKLVESTVPEGYNKMEDVIFDITAIHDVEADEPALTELKGGSLGTGVVDTGIIEKNIENNTGTVLPETGGMGTFLLILGSSILVIVAAVFMITRKKMSVYED